MSELTVLIDLDKTAFRTGDFIRDVADALEARYGLDAQGYLDAVDKAHVIGDEGLRHLAFFDHLDSLGLNSAEIEAYLLQAFDGRDYAYQDLADFLNFLQDAVKPRTSEILTYGEQRFQAFKHHFAPSLGRLSCRAILQPKGPYISEHYYGQQGIIIDDRPIQGLPPTFKQAWLTRGSPDGFGSFDEIKHKWNDLASEILID